MEAGCCVLSQSTPEPDRSLCPECGAAGKPVGMQTLKALLLPEALRLLNAESGFRFCATATCQTLYFSNLQSFRVDAIAIPVTQKDLRPETPVCYCFGFKRKDFLDVGARKAAQAEIGRLVKAGVCACELRNPQGSCCLGTIAGMGRSDPR